VRKYLANLISCVRMIIAISIIWSEPFSINFFILYFICGISDVLDGYLARKFEIASQIGASLDSLADFIFCMVLLIIFLPILALESWMIMWVIGVVAVRFITLSIGYIKYRKLAFLHTYLNKITGAALYCFPVSMYLTTTRMTVIILGFIATISSVEELMIQSFAKELDRDVTGIWK
jgi:phosphatidylglycerophosphate synthase